VKPAGHLDQFEPFVRHQVIFIEFIQDNRRLVSQRGMTSEKIEESHIADHIGVSLIKRGISIGRMVVFLECSVETFFCLLPWTVFPGCIIHILYTDDLVKIKLEALHFKEELGSVIDRISVGNKGEVIGVFNELAHDIPMEMTAFFVSLFEKM